MSMLAERKRKHRWSLNPRGNAWAEDSNKFGQKMLEKMGWKHGKGLGANEDGIKEHPKVSYKNDSQGMGYKETEGWTEHEGNFSALLKNLVGTLDVDQAHLQVKPTSLEETSQKSRVRLHYHKFTKGKDLSRYSEKDLASIFGKKSLTPREDATVKTGAESEKFIKRGCMVDYFKKKLPNFSLNSNNGYTVGSNGVLQVESEGERVGFGYEEIAQSLVAVEHSKEISESKGEEIHIKKKRKRKLEETKNNEERDVMVKSKGEIKDVMTNREEGEDTVKEAKRNRKVKLGDSQLKNDVASEYDGEDKMSKLEKKRSGKGADLQREEQPGFVVEDIKAVNEGEIVKESKRNRKVKLEETTFVSYLAEEVRLKKGSEKIKSQKKKQCKSDDQEEAMEANAGASSISRKEKQVHEAEGEISQPKPKPQSTEERNKKAKKDVGESERGISNPAFDPRFNNIIIEKHALNTIVEGEETFYCDAESETPTNQTLKKRNESLDKNEAEDGSVADLRENPYEVKPKEKKKKKVRTDSPVFHHEQEIKTKSKKRKLNAELALDNPGFQMYGEAEGKGEVKRKLKKSKREGEALALDNPGFQEGGAECPLDNPSFQMNGEDMQHEVKRKEKKLKKSKREDGALALDNPGFQEGCVGSSLDKPPGCQMNGEVEEKHEVKRKAKKLKKSKREALDNPGFQEGCVGSPLDKSSGFRVNGEVEEKHEVKRKLKKSKREDEALALDNPGFQEGGAECSLDNPSFQMNAEIEKKNEVKRKERKLVKSKGKDEAVAPDNSGFRGGVVSENQSGEVDKLGNCDGELLLNVASFPTPKADENVQRSKPRKSVRFDKVVHQKMIRNNYYDRSHDGIYNDNQEVAQNDGNYYEGNHAEFYGDNRWVARRDSNYYGQNHNEFYNDNQRVAQNSSNYYNRRNRDNNGGFTRYNNRQNHNELFHINRTVLQNGIDNVGYDRRANNMQENIAYMSRTLDRFQAEVENDINDIKYRQQHRYVGEPGHPSEKHVKVEEGTRLSFKGVTFGKLPVWLRKNSVPGPKKSYRHLIGGDIIVKFRESNLHEIVGYAKRHSEA